MDLIDRLRTYASTRKGELAELITEAADALERQTCEDAVSRADVIELVKDSYYNLAESIEDTWAMVADVEKLPAVQPQQIVRCKDCKWSDISAMGHLAVCNHARGLVNPSPNSYCNFAERRTDETN